MFAAKTIYAVLAAATVLAILAEIGIVTMYAVHTLCAPFAATAKRHAIAAHTFTTVTSVQKVFTVKCTKAVVATLRFYRSVAVVTVFGHDVF